MGRQYQVFKGFTKSDIDGEPRPPDTGEAAESHVAPGGGMWGENAAGRARLTYINDRMLDLLFVYGTLRSGFDNRYARQLRKEATSLGRATVPGSIYRVEHYPAFRPQPEGEVRGELYRLHTPEITLAVLDEYEGEEFERVMVQGAWLYQYKSSPPEEARIASGDFGAP